VPVQGFFSEGTDCRRPGHDLGRAHKIAIGDSDLINVRFGPLCGLKSDISRGPRSAMNGVMHCNKRGVSVGYSITSLARMSNAGRKVMPSVLAVLRLRTRSNFIGCSIGSSPGFVPFRILPT
jgi:hypothetical protein